MPTQKLEYDVPEQIAVGCVHEAETLEKPPPVAAYPDQFVLVEFVTLWFGSYRRPPAVGWAAASVGMTTAIAAASTAAESNRRMQNPFRMLGLTTDRTFPHPAAGRHCRDPAASDLGVSAHSATSDSAGLACAAVSIDGIRIDA